MLYRASLYLMIVFSCLACATENNTAENIYLPPIYGDGMVIQRGTGTFIRGTADPNTTLTVRVDDRYRSVAQTQPDGQWEAIMPNMEAGGPFDLTIVGKDTLIRIADILIGDVWFCSGQSNMEWPVSNSSTAEELIKSADSFPTIRHFTFKRKMATQPQLSIPAAKWDTCTSETIKDFSAVGFSFGRLLQRELSIPIGLVDASWSGTVAQSWMSAKSLKKFPQYDQKIKELDTMDMEAQEDKISRMYQEFRDQLKVEDIGMRGNKPIWVGFDVNDSHWDAMQIPSQWEWGPLPAFDGIVWFRKKIYLPNTPKDNAKISVGAIDNIGEVFVNGEKVGDTNDNNNPIELSVPPHLLVTGENLIAVRVLDREWRGGMWGYPEWTYLQLQDTTLSLAGEWKYRLGTPYREFIWPKLYPSSIYNGMVAPVHPLTIKGVIWYQGESNDSMAHQYRTLFPTLIESWRAAWGIPNLPFYYTQIANFDYRAESPGESTWAELREAQLMTLDLPHTGMAVTIDIGDEQDIHPRNKMEVGHRLALIAMKNTYGRDDWIDSGPMYQSMEVVGNSIRVEFDAMGSDLTLISDPPGGFSVAGVDRKFYWVDQIQIEGDALLLSSKKVLNPVAVRYGWAQNPEVSLFNREGLPASPFRTDDWPGVTEGKY